MSRNSFKKVSVISIKDSDASQMDLLIRCRTAERDNVELREMLKNIEYSESFLLVHAALYIVVGFIFGVVVSFV